MGKIKPLFVFLVLVAALIPAHAALADTAPKPGMEFTFDYQADLSPMKINSGTLYECDESDCSDAAPLKELGPQGFWCEALTCSATAYGFSQFHRLEIEFSDGNTRQSNIFETAGFDSTYAVTVRPDDLLVESRLSPGSFFPRMGVIVLLCACVFVSGVLAAGVIVFLVVRHAKT